MGFLDRFRSDGADQAHAKKTFTEIPEFTGPDKQLSGRHEIDLVKTDINTLHIGDLSIDFFGEGTIDAPAREVAFELFDEGERSQNIIFNRVAAFVNDQRRRTPVYE